MKKKNTSHKPHGHFCKVCGEHKANEKFSGKGHAAHICKACMSLRMAVSLWKAHRLTFYNLFSSVVLHKLANCEIYDMLIL